MLGLAIFATPSPKAGDQRSIGGHLASNGRVNQGKPQICGRCGDGGYG